MGDDTVLKAALLRCWEEQRQNEEQNEEILHFRRKRAARLRRQNNTAATTRVLPPEILSLFFFYARGDPTSSKASQRDLVNLGQVCSKWRDIVLSIPQLWSHFSLTVDPFSQKQRGLQLLQYFLTNARDCPFFLCISFPRSYPGYHGSAGQILHMLEVHAVKVHTLRVENASWVCVPWLSWLSSVNTLEISSVMLPPTPDVTLSFVKFTHLRSLELSSSSNLRGAQLPWAQMMSLTLKFMPIDFCMSLFLQCPNLIEFHSPSSRRRTDGSAIVPQVTDHVINMQHLQHLTWSYEPDSTCNSFYHRLRFPSLKTLRWHSLSYRRSTEATRELNTIQSLFANIPPTLSQLYLIGASWPRTLTELVLGCSKNLRILHLIKCRYTMVIDTFSLLNRKDTQKRNVLPFLEEIIIQDPEALPAVLPVRDHLETEAAALIISMFSNRDPEKTKLFSLQLAQTSGLASKAMRDAYTLLKKERYAFNIWVDSARINSIECLLDREKRAAEMEERLSDSRNNEGETIVWFAEEQPQHSDDEGEWIVQR